MKDPCRECKCLKYPICIQKERVICKLFEEYIRYYVIDVLKFKHVARALYVSTTCRIDLWNHIGAILPNLKTIELCSPVTKGSDNNHDIYMYQIDKDIYMNQLDRPEVNQSYQIKNLYHNI